MKITLQDGASHPIWYLGSQGPDSVFTGTGYYRSLIPSRMVGGQVESALEILAPGVWQAIPSADGFGRWNPEMAAFMQAEHLTVRGLGRPAIFQQKSRPPAAFIRALVSAGAFVVLDADDWIDGDFRSSAERIMAGQQFDLPRVTEAERKAIKLYHHHKTGQPLRDEEVEVELGKFVRACALKQLDGALRKMVDLTPTALHIASTEPLKQMLCEHDPTWTVVVGPNAVDPKDFRQIERRNDGLVRVGYGASGMHIPDLSLVMPALREVGRNPAVRIVFWGAHPGPGIDDGRVEFDGIGYEFLGFFATVFEHFRHMEGLDIGFCPILQDSRYNRAKSSQKFYEYAMHRVAVVASDVELYRRVIRHGETGFLARDAEEFTKYIRLLVSDADLRRRIGGAAREDVLRRFSTAALAETWKIALAELVLARLDTVLARAEAVLGRV